MATGASARDGLLSNNHRGDAPGVIPIDAGNNPQVKIDEGALVKPVGRIANVRHGRVVGPGERGGPSANLVWPRGSGSGRQLDAYCKRAAP